MFKFDLALTLGECNPDAMAARIPLPTFYKWMDYAARKPFGDERADLRIAMMTSALLNIQLAKGQRRTRPIDFMPFSKDRKDERHSPEPSAKILADLTGMVALHKGHSKKIAEANADRS